jgi:hypothetical protein
MPSSTHLYYKHWKCFTSESSFKLDFAGTVVAKNLNEFEKLSKVIFLHQLKKNGSENCINIADNRRNINIIVSKNELKGFHRFLRNIESFKSTGNPINIKIEQPEHLSRKFIERNLELSLN